MPRLGTEENVGLILAVIQATKETVFAIRSGLDPGVVSARDMRGTDLPGMGVQPPELQPVVAAYAGVRRAPRIVLLDEVVDDPAEFALEINHVERDVESGRHSPGIIGIVDRATSLLADPNVTGLFQRLTGGAQAHEDTNHLPALLHQESCSDRGIDPAAHCHQYLALGSRHI
jgi:hypothetical protein